jgi:hypothetical protein
MGCIWLIRKLIDPQAEFIFIPPHQPIPSGYEPFDIPNIRFTHHQGRCTFHTFIAEYNLKDPILERIASIIDEADTAQVVLVEPIASGLDVLCEGLRLISHSDEEAHLRGYWIYEALYAWLSQEHKRKTS